MLNDIIVKPREPCPPLERHSVFLFQHLICELCYFDEVPPSFWLHLVSL